LAAERNNRLDFDKDTALDAKNFKETNFDAEKNRAFDNSDFNKLKNLDLAKEAAAKNNLEVGEGGIWKRQFDDDDGGDFDIDFDDYDSPSSTTSPDDDSSTPSNSEGELLLLLLPSFATPD
jgi:hypothetical protein